MTGLNTGIEGGELGAFAEFIPLSCFSSSAPERTHCTCSRNLGFNTAFADTHVESLRFERLFDTHIETLRMWNHDHDPHLEDLGPEVRALIR